MSQNIFSGPNHAGSGNVSPTADPHLALVYESQREQFATAVPFIRTGVEQNERCIYCYHDNSREEVLAALNAGGVPVERALEDGRLTIVPAEEVYLEGGTFDRDRVTAMLDELAEETVESDEFERLRVTAENTWLADVDTPAETFFEYDAGANHVIDHDSFVGLCQFSRNHFDDHALANVLRTHQHVAFDDHYAHNAHYESPEEFRPSEGELDIGTTLQELRKQAELAQRAGSYRTVATEFADISESSEDLSKQAVIETAVDTLRRVLEASAAGFWLYDSMVGDLDLVTAATDASVQKSGQSLLAPLAEQAWDVFTDNELQVQRGNSTDSSVEHTVVVPVGDHGVLVVAGTRESATDRVVDIATVVSSQAAMSLHAVEREQDVRDRERTLEARTESLGRLTEINETVRRVTTGLVEARTVEAAAERVCDELVDGSLFRFAWLGEHDDVGGELEPTAWAGTGRGYLDSVPLNTQDSQSEPAVSAARDGELATTTDIVTQLHEEEWRQEALVRELRAAAAVPLVYDDVQYGVLAVYAGQSDALDDPVPEVISELGELVAYVFNAVDRKQSLLTDQTVQLTFEFRDSRSPIMRLAQEAGCELSLEATVPKSHQRTLGFFDVRGGNVDSLVDAAEDAVAVLDYRVVEADEDGGFVQLELQRPFLATVLADHGVVLRSMTADESAGRATVAFPDSTDVRSVVRAMTNAIPDAELVSKQEVSQPAPTDTYDGNPIEALTDRQGEILQTAHHAGYFEVPRQCDGESVADMLDITSPTFHQHRRLAINSILQSLLDD